MMGGREEIKEGQKIMGGRRGHVTARCFSFSLIEVAGECKMEWHALGKSV